MRQQFLAAFQSGTVSRSDCLPEVLCVPIDDDRREQVEACHAIVLSLSGAVADFALPPDTQGVFQSVMRLTFVETDLSTALHVSVKQPVNDEECSLNAPDFTQGQRQLMLAGIGCATPSALRPGRRDIAASRADRGCAA